MLLKTIDEVKAVVKQWKEQGFSIGYVPTMGALHQGHKSLMERAVAENDRVIASVFVNPTQFGPNEDYSAYPRDIEKDYEICKSLGVHGVFNPEPEELYLPQKATTIHVSGLTDVLCGAKRPGHFDGVCLVVSKFFHIVTPHRAYFGEKDAQQVAVIKKMVRDLNMDVQIVSCPIIRESNGLAKSSRNAYLSPKEKEAALVLSKSLQLAKKAMMDGERDANILKQLIINTIDEEPLTKIDYVEVVDSNELSLIQGPITKSVLVAIAVYVGTTRLIDNFTFIIE